MISPDTYIPNPENVLDWDRFAYSRNNPIRYNDPSGNTVCDAEGYCQGTGKRFRAPIPIPQLTEAGEAIRDIYLQYLSAEGWWKSSGSFGLNEFLGMWILFESYSRSLKTWRLQAEKIAIAIAQNMFTGGWNDPFGQSSYALFNFMGAWKDGKSGINAGPSNPSIEIYPRVSGWGDEAGQLISDLGRKARNRASIVSKDQWGGPSIWGNVEGLRNVNIPNNQFGLSDNSVFDKNGSFVILTVRQYNYWSLQVDMTLTYKN